MATSNIFKLPRPAPVNGVPQWGRASQTPFVGVQTLKGPRPTFQSGVINMLRGTTGSPQTTGGGGGNPYAGLLNEFLNSSKARFAADSAADAASRDAALRRYIISYGQVPDFDSLGISKETRGFLEKATDQATRDLANKNTAEGTSVFARTKAANDKAMARVPAVNASRGMLRSGETGYQEGQQQQAYKIQGFDQLNEMLGGMEGTVGNFLQAERARADALAQAELQQQMAAYDNYGGDVSSTEDDGPSGPSGNTPRTSVASQVRGTWKPPKPRAKVFLGGSKKKVVKTTASAANRRK